MIRNRIVMMEASREVSTEFKAGLKSIKQLLKKIDFKYESVPLDDLKKLQKLLVYLKGSELSYEEEQVLPFLVY